MEIFFINKAFDSLFMTKQGSSKLKTYGSFTFLFPIKVN